LRPPGVIAKTPAKIEEILRVGGTSFELGV